MKKINLSEKGLKIVIGVGGFFTGLASGVAGTFIFVRRKNDFKGIGKCKTYKELMYEHNKIRAERRAAKEAKKTVDIPEDKIEVKEEPSEKSVETTVVTVEEVKEPEVKNDIPSSPSPHWIKSEMFYDKENNYDKVTLDYYMDDDTFSLNDEAVLDILEFNGEEVANFFHAVNVSDVQYDSIYVRNDILRRDYEIRFHFGSYAEEILGIDPGDDFDNPVVSDIDYDEENDEEEFDPILDELDEGPGDDE